MITTYSYQTSLTLFQGVVQNCNGGNKLCGIKTTELTDSANQSITGQQMSPKKIQLKLKIKLIEETDFNLKRSQDNINIDLAPTEGMEISYNGTTFMLSCVDIDKILCSSATFIFLRTFRSLYR